MVKGLVKYVMLAGALVFLSSQAGLALTIDTFDTTAQSVTADSSNNPNFSYVNTAVGEAVGGQRDIWVNVTTFGTSITGAVDQSNNNEYSHSEAASTRGQSRVTWDGTDNNANSLAPTGLGGVDLTDSGVNSFLHVNVAYATTAYDLRFDVYTDGSNWSQLIKNVPPDTVSAQDVYFKFSDFITQAGTGADFTNVGAIEMWVLEPATETEGTVTRMDIVNTTPTPEPATMCLALLSLFGGYFMRRKARKKAA